MFFEQYLKSSVESFIPKKNKNKKIAIAFSGGFDSSALLFTASRCWTNDQLMSFHINHQLSPDSDKWEEFCLKQSQALGINFFSKKIKIKKKIGKGLEAIARIQRYGALNELSNIHCPACLLLAHHADDQAETIMFRIIRGTGIDGLTGIPVICKNNKIGGLNSAKNTTTLFIRPWLNFRRREIFQYTGGHFNWINDPSNNDESFSRNKIRKLFRENLELCFPNYHSSIMRLSRIAAQYKHLATLLADQDLNELIETPHLAKNPTKISRKNLLFLEKDRIGNALRRWIQLRELLPPSEKKLNELIKYIFSKNASCIWKHEGKTLRVTKEYLFWEETKYPKSLIIKKLEYLGSRKFDAEQFIFISERNIQEIIEKGETCFTLKYWSGLICLRKVSYALDNSINIYYLQNKKLVIKPRLGGERMLTKIGGMQRSLKNLFQEHKIPAESRDLPILFSNGRIIFVPFIGVDLEWAKMTRVKSEEQNSLCQYVEVLFVSL